MKVIVCEDDSIYRKSICDKIEMWKKKTAHNDVHICEFLSSEDMLEQWENGLRADLIFLDIHFHNELDGIEIAKQIRLADEGVPLVFITNYESFWREGYTVYALRYLSKPVAYDDIAPCLDIAYRRMQSMNANFFVINLHI